MFDCLYTFLFIPIDVPRQPTEFQEITESITETTARLSWKPGFNGGLPQTFIIQYRTDGDVWTNITAIPDNQAAMEMDYTLTQLSPGTMYTAQIIAYNDIGESGKTSVVNFTTIKRNGKLNKYNN
mgnify:CR=1 FL=1